jgi:PKD repeat protein
MGVYADNNGAPGSLLLDAGQIPVVNGWNSISNLNLPVKANVNYWLSFIQSGSNPVVYSTADTHTDAYVKTTYGSLPASFPTGYSSGQECYVMRATVSAGTTPGPTPTPTTPVSAPKASFNTSLTAQFTDASTGNVSGWLWNFGDGTTSTARNPSHIYSSPGTYTVIETITGPGGSSSVSHTLIIN